MSDTLGNRRDCLVLENKEEFCKLELDEVVQL